MTDKPEFNPMLVSCAEDMSTCTLTLGDGKGYFYNRVDADPVPPACGEPEVVGRQCFPSEEMAKVQAYRKTPWIDDGVGQQPSTPGFYRVEPLIRLSDHRAHVTRLQAEVFEFRTALQVANKNTKQVMAERAALQTELTKARELLKDIQNSTIDTVLSNQSAPADDCAHSEANKHGCPECGEEFKSADKGHGEPVAWVQGFPRTGHFPAKLQEDRKNGYTIALYAKQPAPVAVVMPDRMVDFPKYDKLIAQGYNRCLDDVIRLNGVKP